MNKTININLGGLFYHIDEIAYEKLKRYLAAISKSLSDDPQGKNEIIADIEARISELLSEKITDARQVVNENDIDSVIAIMGQPEDYAETEETYNQASYSYKRNNTTNKKLFRDGDDKFLGGVAAGIGHYFNIDAIWVRLALLALFFGAGFGILLYIILWILLPEATTTAEKLQMEGEPVNIDNIEKKIREEFNNVSDNVRDVANQASEKIKNGANEFSEKMNKTFSGKTTKNNGLQDFLNTIGSIILMLFKVIGKLIGILLIFIAAAVILSLIIGGFSVGSLEFLSINEGFLQYPSFFYNATIPKWALTLCMFFLVGIPFLILFILGLRILSSNVKRISKTTSLLLFGIWILALLGIVFTAIEFGTTHANTGQFIEKQTLNSVANDTITLKIKNDDTLYFQQNLRTNTRKHEVEIDGVTKIYTNNIQVDVKKSNTKEPYIIVQKESRGKNRKMASENAEKIAYNFSVENNSIVLDAYFLSDFRNIWRDEEINIIVYIPENNTIYFDDSIKNFLDDVKNEGDIYDTDMANHHFIMTDTTLKCTDCKTEILEKVETLEEEAEVINQKTI